MLHDLDQRPPAWRYGLGILAVLLAALVTMASQYFGLADRSAAFLAAILLTGWYAGMGPMVVTLVLSTLTFDYLFLTPLHTLGLQWRADPYLIWFLIFALLAGWFSLARRRNALLLEETRSELEARVAARTTELKRSEAFLIAGQRMSHTGSFSRRVDTGEASWSDEVYRIYGLDPRTSTPPRDLRTRVDGVQVQRAGWHPDDQERAAATIAAAIRERRGYEIDLRVVRADGSVRYVHSVAQAVYDANGEVAEFIGVLMDITARRRTERALRRSRVRALENRFAAVLAERTRLAREIHDTLLQGFTGVALQLVAVANRVGGEPETASSLRDVVRLAQRTLEDARRAVWDMRAPSLASGELPAILRIAAEDGTRGTGLDLDYSVDGEPRPLEAEVQAVVFRVLQEAIANAVKHAAARRLRVRCSYDVRCLRLSIADDGAGFQVDPDFRAYGGHWGLLGMRERASQVGAKVSVRSAPGEGTEILLAVPYAA